MAGGLYRRKRRDANGKLIPCRNKKGEILFLKDKDGKPVLDKDDNPIPIYEELPCWYIWWTDSNGRKRYAVGYRDKESSRQKLAQKMREAARGEVGLADTYATYKKIPLTKHLEEFISHLRSRGVSEKYAQGVAAHLRKAFAHMESVYPPDMTATKAEAYLLHLVETEHCSAKTRNDHLAALTHFGKWGVERGRWASNPFAGIAKLNAAADVRRQRRALTEQELAKLLAAAETRAVENYLARCPNASAEYVAQLARRGHERSLIYRTAALTGLRRKELKTLTWANVDLASDPPMLTVEARHAKARRTDRVPIQRALVDALAAWRELRSRELGRPVREGEVVFHIPHRLLEQFQKDCQHAGIELEDSAGRVVDFHSLRHTTATLLSKAGVSPRVAQAILRHADIKTTMRTYTHLELIDRVGAVEALPSFDVDVTEVAVAVPVGANVSGEEMTTYMTTKSRRGGAIADKSGQRGDEGERCQNGDPGPYYGPNGKSGQLGATWDSTQKWHAQQDSNLQPAAP